MGLMRTLFGRRRMTAAELKVALLGIERRRARKAAALEEIEGRRRALIERARAARRLGNQLEVDHLFEELKLLESEGALARREARIANLETLALQRTARRLERLEALDDRAGARRLLRRVHDSGLDDHLLAGEIREEEYIHELEDILDEAGEEGEKAPAAADPRKEAFLRELDAQLDSKVGDGSQGGAERERERRPPVPRPQTKQKAGEYS
jgi:hypothetical protein